MTGQASRCERVPQAHFDLRGVVRDYVEGITEQWLLVAPLSNPAILEMFRDRDSPPQRQLVPWAGEFAGKYLTSAVQVLRVTGDPRLRGLLGRFVDRLLGLQDADGYLGPWPKANRLTNFDPQQRDGGMITWDTWGHYHVMLGLLLWYEESGDERALGAAARIGDLICDRYLGQREKRLVDTGQTEMNLAPVHSLCLLYRQTAVQRCLDMALQIVDEFAAQGPDGPLAGDYLGRALSGSEFYEMPKPRWESLHPIMGLAELYWITGDEQYRQAFEHIWWSIVKLDRHNTGGFSSGEKASGNPYDRGPIETCCTIAWIALSVEMLKLSGNSVVADEIELATVNSVVGMHSSTGRWATYNTPMDGVRRASAHSIVFQAREGSPELNCCSVNSPRGFGMIGDWAVMRDEEGLILNYYGPSTIRVDAATGCPVTLTQDTDYPRSGRILLRVEPAQECEFALKLRIPYWSSSTKVSLNDQAVLGVVPEGYLTLERTWQEGDTILLDLDMSLHFWAGEQECANLTSVYRGPILLTYDHRYNLALAAGKPPSVRQNEEWTPGDDAVLDMPALDAHRMRGRVVRWEDWLPPWILLEFEAVDGRTVRLCDFGSAGEAGTPYRSWLTVENAPGPTAFSRQNPLRSERLT
jgi:DUF1680 family protein